MSYDRKSVEIWKSNRVIQATVSWIMRFRLSTMSSSILPGYLPFLCDRYCDVHWKHNGESPRAGRKTEYLTLSETREDFSITERQSVRSRQ